MINDISFHGNYIDISLDEEDINSFKVTKKCLRYIDSIRNSLDGVYIFDQVSIDNVLKSIVVDKGICLELSIIFLRMASIYQNIQVFQYINDEYYLPYIVFSVDNNYVVCNDYCYINSFFNYLDECFWNLSIDDIKLVSSKYNLSFLNDDIHYICVDDFYTITDILNNIDLNGDNVIVGGNDIIFDLAVSLGIKYVLIDKNSNINSFFDIVNKLDIY